MKHPYASKCLSCFHKLFKADLLGDKWCNHGTDPPSEPCDKRLLYAMKKLIVTRHPAAAEFIREELGSGWQDAEIKPEVTEEDVKNAVVAGNLPLHLAAKAARVLAVEFEGPPPRGAEFTVEDMRSAGARIMPYVVYLI
jgi:hypothetical protein